MQSGFQMSLLIAIATAGVFAVFGLPYRHYQCWFSFSKLGTVAGTLLYLLLAGGGGGALGWGLATLANADPTTNMALNGVLYGITGALAVRADFAAGPRPDTARKDQLSDARSALSLSIKWTTSLLDEVAARRAEAWLIGMSDDQLSEEAFRVQANISRQPDTTDKVKKELSGMLVVNMEQLVDDNTRAAARAQLINFCASYYMERHLAKTPRAAVRRRAPRRRRAAMT